MADFTYDRKWIMRSTLFLTVAVIWVMVLIVLLLPFDTLVTIVMGLALGLFLLVVGVSPFLTRHSVDANDIILRQGWHFTVSVPIENIKAINLIDEAPKDRSLLISQTKGILNITSCKRDLISLKLRRPQRIASVFWRKVDEIVFDVTDREGFRSAFETALLSTRASPARSSSSRP